MRRSIDKQDVFLALLLLFTGTATVIDLMSDSLAGESRIHLLIEGAIFVGSGVAFVLLFVRIRNNMVTISKTSAQLSESGVEAEKWRKRAQVFLDGLGTAIQAQFDDWRLTRTEKEIAMYLIKGFSHKEIARITNRSERTVRQHAGEVYQKSGLNGRAELAAFFLEDLLPGNTVRT